jgi:hypothetical protein
LSAASRFRHVLRQAAYAAWRKFPGVLSLDDARSYANERLALYASDGDGSSADSGALRGWQEAVSELDDPHAALDRYVMQALTCDLSDYARGLINRKGSEIPAGDGERQGVDPNDETRPNPREFLVGLLNAKSWDEWRWMDRHGWLASFPMLKALHIDGMTREEMAETLGWSTATLDRRIAEEKEALAEKFYKKVGDQ